MFKPSSSILISCVVGIVLGAAVMFFYKEKKTQTPKTPPTSKKVSVKTDYNFDDDDLDNTNDVEDFVASDKNFENFSIDEIEDKMDELIDS